MTAEFERASLGSRAGAVKCSGTERLRRCRVYSSEADRADEALDVFAESTEWSLIELGAGDSLEATGRRRAVSIITYVIVGSAFCRAQFGMGPRAHCRSRGTRHNLAQREAVGARRSPRGERRCLGH